MTASKDSTQLDERLAGKPALIRSLYDVFHTRVMGLGDDVTRRVTKFYINYSVEKSFATAQPMVSLIKVHMTVP